MVVAVTVLQVATLGPGSLDRIVTVATMNMPLALGVYVFSGNSGVITFGQLAFAAVGAYTAGLMRIPPGTEGTDPSGAPELHPERVAFRDRGRSSRGRQTGRHN